MRIPVLAALLLCVLACSDVAPTNPYDPQTPADQQAKGAVRGRVVLPERFGAAAFEGGRATLSTAASPAEVAFDTALTPEGESPAASFVLEKVPGGLYWLRVQLTGFDAIERLIEVPRGGDADVGDLSPAVRADAVVEGQARFEGEAAASHEGILVSALGTPFVALTAPDGAFRLALSEGTFTLRASREGYESDTVEDVVVTGAGTTRLEEPLVLRAAPGAVHVTIRLQPADDQARLVVGASVALAPADGGEAILAVQPDARGDALLSPVPAGEYVLSVTLAGFGTDTRPVIVVPGQATEAGTITLAAAVDAVVEGTARLRGEAVVSHQGILVTVDDLPATAITGPDGTFRLPVNVGRHTLRAHFPGYDDAVSDPLDVAAPGAVALPKVLELNPQPGAVRVRVQPEPDFDAVQVELWRAAVSLSPEAGGEAIARGAPDAEGLALLAGVVPGRYRLRVELAGFTPAERLVDVTPAATTDAGNLILFAELDGAIRGLANLAGADDHAGISVESDLVPGLVYTDAEGAFELASLAGTHTLTFRRPGYATAQVNGVVVEPGGVADLPDVVVLEGQPGALTGTVALAAGFDTPESRAAIDVEVSPVGGQVIDRVRPDAAGRWLVPDLPARRYEVTFTHAGFAPERREATVPVGLPVEVPHVVLQAPGDNLVLDGRAELDGALAHSGIRVEIAGTGYFTETTADGTWQIQCVAEIVAGREVRFTFPGYSPVTQTLPLLLAPPTHHVEDVPRLRGEPGALRGIVIIDDRFAEPALMAQVIVRLSHLEGDAIVDDTQVTPTADGVYVFPDLPVGDYLIEARLENFLPGSAAARVDLGAQTQIEPLFLSPDDANRRGVLAGRVRLAGRPDGEHGGIRVEIARRPYVAFTGADGEFELEALAGSYAVEFRYQGYGLERLPAVEVPAQGRYQLPADVVLTGQPGRVLGTISLPAGFDGDGRMVAVQVAVRDALGELVLSRNPSVDGNFVLAPLVPGDYAFEASLAGFRTERLPFTLGPGESVDVRQVLLTPEPVPPELAPHIAGRAEREGAGAGEHGGIRVEVLGTPYVAVTNSDGRFDVTTLPESTRLRFVAESYSPEERGPYDMAAERVRDLEVEDGVVTLHGAPGRIRGVVGLPEGFDAQRFAQVSVQARQDDAPVAQVAPDQSGLFVLDALPAGTYDLAVTLAGADPLSLPVTVEVGQTRDVGLLPLRVTRLEGAVTGTARLQGVVNAQGHGGIRVESQGTPFATVTTEAGLFSLDLTPGPHTLVFSYPGYGRQTVGPTQIPAGPPALALGAQVVLPAQPGLVTGQVNLVRFGTPARLQGTDVEILDGRNVRVSLVHPGLDGRFTGPDLAAGAYTVRAFGVGYSAQARAVVVPVGGAVDAGSFDLLHKSTTPDAVLFAGRVRTSDGRELAGTQVRLRLSNPDLAFATLTTDAAGRFEALVAPDEAYRATVQRPGYVDPVLDTTWRWDAADARVESDAGAPFDVTLVAAPLEGRVQATIRITPDWIPAEQQWIRATLRSDAYEATLAQATEAAPVLFTRVPAGRYVLSLERPGFTSVQVPLTLDIDHPEVILPLVDVRLTSLAAAQIDLGGRTLDACELRRSDVDLRGADLSGVSLTGDFSAAGGAACAQCVRCGAFDLTRVDLTNADLTRPTSMAGVTLEGAELFGAQMAGRNLRGANLAGANLFGADLTGAFLAGANLTNANLTSARLVGARLVDANEASPPVPCAAGGARPGVLLTNASFAQTDLTRAVMRGVQLEGATLSSATLVEADLRFACLRNTTMSLTDLSRTLLDRADLTGAALTSSILNQTTARGAQLVNASLIDAVIEAADLGLLPNGNVACNPYPWQGAAGTTYDERCVGDARFTDARCCRTELDGANLNGANLVGASLEETDLRDASLLGLTMGTYDALPSTQPRACQPERWNDCRDVCRVINECTPLDVDCDRFVGECQQGLIDYWQGTYGPDTRPVHEVQHPGYIACVAASVEAQPQCQLAMAPLSSCREDPDRVPPREPPCTWAMISDPEANGACEPDRIPPNCTERPTSMHGARLTGAEMTAVVLNSADLSDALLDGAVLRGAAAYDPVMNGASLVGADLSNADLAYSLYLSGLDLTNANVTRTDLTEAMLFGSELTGARFTESRMTGADLAMAHAETPVEGGPEPAVLRGVDLSRSSLFWAELPGAQLQAARIVDAELTGVSLPGAILDRATVTGADLECANLDGASLLETDLRGAQIEASTFRNAKFNLTDLTGAFLSSVDMTGAKFLNTELEDASLGSSEGCPRERDPTEIGECPGAEAIEQENCTTAVGSYFDRAQLARAGLGGDFTDATFRHFTGIGVGVSFGVFRRAAFYKFNISSEDYVPGMDLSGLFPSRLQGADLRESCPLKVDFIGKQFVSTQIDGMTVSAGSAVCNRGCRTSDGVVELQCTQDLAACTGARPAVGQFPTCARFLKTEIEDQAVNDLSLPHISVQESDWTGSTFTRATLRNLEVNASNFDDIQFVDSTLDDAIIGDTTMFRARFTRTSLQRAKFDDTSLGSSIFSGANLTGATLATCAGNTQFVDNGAIHTNLTDARFTDVIRGDVSFGNFTNATLTRTNFGTAWVTNANMTGATANQAVFLRANLASATMRNMNLTGADVRACNFQSATWGGSNFSGATMCDTDYTWLTAVGANRCVGCTNLASVNRVVCALNCAAYTDPCP